MVLGNPAHDAFDLTAIDFTIKRVVRDDVIAIVELSGEFVAVGPVSVVAITDEDFPPATAR